VASTIIGVASVAQLDEDLNAWGRSLFEVLKAIDAIRWELRDPALWSCRHFVTVPCVKAPFMV
jgi:hypothetical protein